MTSPFELSFTTIPTTLNFSTRELLVQDYREATPEELSLYLEELFTVSYQKNGVLLPPPLRRCYQEFPREVFEIINDKFLPVIKDGVKEHTIPRSTPYGWIPCKKNDNVVWYVPKHSH